MNFSDLFEAWNRGELLPRPWDFRDPWFLLVGLAAPAVFFLAHNASSRLRYSTLSIVEGMPRSLRVKLRLVPAILYGLALLPIAVALAGPRIGNSESRVSREGVAIELCIDRSTSMFVIDLDPEGRDNRMDVLKEVVDDFVARRPDDLIGLVTFGTYADQVAPLTLHHEGVRTMLSNLEPYPPSVQRRRRRTQDLGATAIGDGVGLACARLEENDAESKIIILMTDGRQTAGEIEPATAGRIASELGIKVYAIGLGSSSALAYVPEFDEDGRPSGRVRQIDKRRQPGLQFEPEPLQEIAAQTGGRYFHAGNLEELEQIYDTIDALERSEIVELRYLQYDERYAPWLIAGCCMIALALILEHSVFRRQP